jgi:hypothetical protein
MELIRLHTVSKLMQLTRLEMISHASEIAGIHADVTNTYRRLNSNLAAESQARHVPSIINLLHAVKVERLKLMDCLCCYHVNLVISETLLFANRDHAAFAKTSFWFLTDDDNDSDPEGLKSFKVSEATASVWWLSELSRGNPVICSVQELSASGKGSVGRYDSIRDLQQSLVGSGFTQPAAGSMLILPVSFDFSACSAFLVLIEKQPHVVPRRMPLNLPVVPLNFGANDVDVFAQTGLQYSLSEIIGNILSQQNLARLSSVNDRFATKLDNLAGILSGHSNKKTLASVFGRWRAVHIQSAEKKRQDESKTLIACVKEAFSKEMECLERSSHHHKSLSHLFKAKYARITNDDLRLYQEQLEAWKSSRRALALSLLEAYASRLFPNDVIAVIHGSDVGRSGSRPSAHSSASDVISVEIEGNREVLVGRISGVDSLSPLFAAAVQQVSETNEFINLVAPHPTSMMEQLHIGSVKVTRVGFHAASKTSKSFQQHETILLKDLCELLSAAYSTVTVSGPLVPPYSLCDTADAHLAAEAARSQADQEREQLEADNAALSGSLELLTGNVLPTFARVLPMLLNSTLQDSISSFLTEFPAVVKLIKSIFGSDVILLRLLAGSATGLPSDVVFSSEDALSNKSRSSGGRSKSAGTNATGTIFAIKDLVHRIAVAAQSAESYSSSGEGSDDSILSEPHLDQFCFQMTSAIGKSERHHQQNEMLAEVRMVGTDGGELQRPTQVLIMEIISYIIAFAVSSTRRYEMLHDEFSHSRHQIANLEQQSHGINVELAKERGLVEGFRQRLGAALQFIVFLTKSSDVASLEQLGNIISQALPTVFQVAKVSLLVLQPATADNSRQEFYDIIGDNYLVDDVLDNGSHEMHHREKIVSGAYLRTLPTFPESSAHTNMPSKLFLKKLPTNSQYHYCLLIQNTNHTGSASSPSQPWTGLEEIISNAITSCIVNCSTKVEIAHSINVIKVKLHEAEAVHVERSRLGEEVVRLQTQLAGLAHANDELTNECVSLRQNLATTEKERDRGHTSSTAQLEELTRSRGEIEREFVAKVDEMNQQIADVEASKKATNDSKASIMNIVHSFGSDRRVHGGRVLEWLHDYVDAANAQLEFVAQEVDGKLTGHGKVERIRGAVAAAGEAIRTGNCVCFMTSFAATSHLFHDTDQPASSSASGAGVKRRHSLDLSHERSKLSEHIKISVYCVPNLAIIPGRASSHACAVFARVSVAHDKDFEGFSISDQEILKCSTTLSYTQLFKEASALDPLHFQQLEENVEYEREKLARIRAAVSICEQSWGRGAKTHADVVNAIEQGAVSLMNRGVSDPCSTEAFFWFPPWAMSTRGGMAAMNGSGWMGSPYHSSGSGSPTGENLVTVLSHRGYGSEIDVVSKILTTGNCYRHVGIMWCPVRTTNGDIVAMLRLERKLVAVVEGMGTSSGRISSSSNVSSSNALFGAGDPAAKFLPSIESILISEEEEEVLRLFCRMSYPLIDRLACTHDAVSTVRQASQAISVLQDAKSELEHKLSDELTLRLQVEETLKAGISLLQLASGHRVSSMQLMEAARLAVVNVTGSEDSYVLYPEYLIQVGEDAKSKSKESFTGAGEVKSDYLDEDQSEDGSYQVSPLRTAPRRSSGRGLVSFEPNRREVIHAKLTGRDLESLCLHKGRVLVSPMQDHEENEDGRSSGRKMTPTLAAVCPSWTARRMRKNSVDGGRVSGRDEIFVLAVPWNLPLQYCVHADSSNGDNFDAKSVITAGRRSAPYNSADQETVLWIGKVLSHCLAVTCSEESRKDWQGTVADMRNEVARLSHLHGITSGIESSLDEFLDDLSEQARAPARQESPSSTLTLEEGSMEERIATAARFVFGRKNVNVLFATRPDIPLGELALTPPTRGYASSKKDSRSLTVRSGFGVVEAWIDSAEDVFAESSSSDSEASGGGRVKRTAGRARRAVHSVGGSSLAASIAKLQFQYQLSNAHRSISGATVGQSPPPFMDQTHLFHDNADGVLMLVKYNGNQQAVLLRISQNKDIESDNETSSFEVLDRVWRLRILLMLRIVDSEVPWISKLTAKAQVICTLETKIHVLQQQISSEIEQRKEQIDTINSMSEEQVALTKDKYKALLKERSRLYTLGEIFHVAGYAAGSNFHAQLLAHANESNIHAIVIHNEPRDLARYVQQAMERLCITLAGSVSTVMWLGSGELETGEVIDDQYVEESKPFHSHRKPLNWIRVDTAGVHRHNAAQGIPSNSDGPLSADDLAVALALQSGSIVVVSASPDDGTIQKAEEYSQKLFQQSGYSQLFSTGRSRRDLAFTAVVTATPACGHPVGTIFIPIVLRSVGLQYVVVASAMTPLAAVTISNSNVDQLPEGRDLAAQSKNSTTMLATQLTTWMMLTHVILDSVQESMTLEESQKVHVKSRLDALSLIEARHRQQRHSVADAFDKLKIHRLEAQVVRGVQVEKRLASTRDNVGRLEESLADWTELAKGISGKH